MPRLDVYLADLRKISRERAQELIKNGYVSVNGRVASKPSMLVGLDFEVIVTEPDISYVGRGGHKLEHALSEFGIDLSGKVCADIGASTGGFTDCMLQRGAAKVYAIDAGTGQLAPELTSDRRVVSLEKCDIRRFDIGLLNEKCEFAAIDVSFISLTKVISSVLPLMNTVEMVCLIKPQFEAGLGNVPKSGIVKDVKVHLAVLETIYRFSTELKLNVCGLISSPIKGDKGNKEFLIYYSGSKPLDFNTYMNTARKESAK